MDNEAFQVSTPLFRAIENGEAVLVKRLLDEGADPNECNGHEEDSALLIAAIEGRSAVVEHLIAAGASVNIGDSAGYTPLMGAVCADSLPIVHSLLAAGADVNRVCARSGATALHDAASSNHLEIVKALLDAGANPNAEENLDGCTPLMCAVQALAPRVTELLLQHGALATARSSRGDSPLDYINNELPYLWEPIKCARARRIQALLQAAAQASSPATN